jgi:hypothetical protein
MLDMYILSVAMEQEAKTAPRSEDALRAEWRTADQTGVVGPRLRAALRCAVFDDTFYRERAKRLEQIINRQEVQRAANH